MVIRNITPGRWWASPNANHKIISLSNFKLFTSGRETECSSCTDSLPKCPRWLESGPAKARNQELNPCIPHGWQWHKDWIITTASQGNWSQEPELGIKHRYADGWWNLAVCCWTQAFLVPHRQIFNWPLFLRLSASPRPHDFTQKFRSASTPYLQPVVSVPEYPLESELKGTEIKRFHAVGLVGQLPVCGLSLQWLQAWGIESCTWSSAPDVTAVTSTQTVLENQLHWWKGILGVWQTHP